MGTKVRRLTDQQVRNQLRGAKRIKEAARFANEVLNDSNLKYFMCAEMLPGTIFKALPIVCFTLGRKLKIKISSDHTII